MTDEELTGTERDALEEWPAMSPPADFADRVVAAREAPAVVPPTRKRWPWLAGGVGSVAAAGVAIVLLRGGHHAGHGELAATTQRTTLALADRGVAVAEAAAELDWRVDDAGATEIDQRAGDVFYRVEHGGPFVIHTPEGDVRVTGTCLRVEVSPMKSAKQMIIGGVVGAALASAVIITVYEGRVVAETKGARTELAAGTRATLGGGASTVATATASEPATAARLEHQELVRLRARVGELEHQLGSGAAPAEDESIIHPSQETLLAWAATCEVSADVPNLDRFTPIKNGDDLRGLEPAELDDYNAVMAEQARQWHDTVRAAYLDTTGDTSGADTLSVEAMRHEVDEKSPPGENAQIRQRISRERAGLATPPLPGARMSPLERLVRAFGALGDQSEAALAQRIGAARAKAARGHNWSAVTQMSGCPKD